MEKYNFSKIESKWQKVWEKEGYGVSKDFSNKPKHYHLVEFPYPSGAGLHVGHCMGYGASDAYCRMKRMQGFNVMYPIGWDAFGLPTENYAIRTGTHPSKATADSVAIFKNQIGSLGYSFDWPREINTTDPEYYKWTQWIFLQFYKHGCAGTVPVRGQSPLVEVADNDTTTPRLAYQQKMPINWCPSCKIGLANEEVINGACERCGTQTEKKMQKQWLLRITAYADRLIDDLNTVDYLDKIKTQQINWIGRSEGALVRFKIKGRSGIIDDEEVEVFTTRADTLFGATYMVVAPEHEIIEKLKNSITNYEEVLHYIQEVKSKSDLERTELNKEKSGVEIKGIKAINPVNNAEIPVFVADYVLASYGTGAIMAVPAHDERDWEFAKKYKLPIRTVIEPTQNLSADRRIKTQNHNMEPKTVFIEYGVLVNSNNFNGLSSEQGKKKIIQKLKEANAGDFAVNYKLRDWIFSRQHYWGEPIPIIHCMKCGTVPVPENQLPVKLPEVENYQPTNTGESPLAKIGSWVNTTCPKCGGPAKRETDTMPNWAGSSWYFIAYAMSEKFQLGADRPLTEKVKSEKLKNIFTDSRKELDYWMPVDLYNGGMEHTTLHLLYSRFWNKFLFDLGAIPTSEPYAKRIAHGIILGQDGQKMSKSRGNVINPDDMVKKFGADTLRAYIMFIGPYDQESAWNTAGVQGVHRFLTRVWNNQDRVKPNIKDPKDLLVKLNQTIADVTSDLENFQMNTVISKLMEFNNLVEKFDRVSTKSFVTFLKLLCPAAPHLAEELFFKLTGERLTESRWPQADPALLVADEIEIVVQINGKVRGKLRVKSGITDEELRQTALAAEKIRACIGDQKILKTIVVPKKLVSIVTD